MMYFAGPVVSGPPLFQPRGFLAKDVFVCALGVCVGPNAPNDPVVSAPGCSVERPVSVNFVMPNDLAYWKRKQSC